MLLLLLLNFYINCRERGMKKLLLATFLTLFVSQAQAALTLTIDSYTTDEISFTISGTFDVDTIGSQPGWLAVKNVWSSNIGSHTDWFSGAPIITVNSITFDGSAPNTSYVGSGTSTSNDSIYFQPYASFNTVIPSGTVVAGSITITGVGMFNPADATTLELISGWDLAGSSDWARLEAAAVLGVSPVIAPVPTLSQYAIFLLILSLMFVSIYLKRRNQY